MSAPEDYEEEAAFYREAIIKASDRPVRTVLELGSGGGNNASHLKEHFDMTLVDPSPGMLAVSRTLNPECEHVEGDMRDVRLGRTFDAVFNQDAICYMTTVTDLGRAIETAFVHCAPGGVALFAPDYVRETFSPRTDHGGHDGDGVAFRHLEWAWDPDPSDDTYVVDYAYLIREGENVRVEHDRHIEGLFSRETWLQAIEAAGFRAEVIPFEHSEIEWLLQVFIGRRPA